MSIPFRRVIFFGFALACIIVSIHGEEHSTDEHAADVTDVLKWLSDNANDTMSRLSQFLKIPSVSADPSRRSDVLHAANWLSDELTDAGLENVQLLESPLHPSVYADWLHAADTAPTVLLYAHFDVQPEDPVALWDSPPFEPIIRDGLIFARGVSDDKGYLYVVLTVLRAFLKTKGKLPVNVKVFFEGEEEIGSPNLPQILSNNAKLLSADVAFSADGGQRSTKIPVVLVGLRGLIALEVFLSTAETDMHSGSFGGGVQNPVHALVRLLDTLHDPTTGRILIPSYYDDVNDASKADREDIAIFPFSAEESLSHRGVNASVGEEGYSFYERFVFFPPIDLFKLIICYSSPSLPYQSQSDITNDFGLAHRTWIRPTVEIVGISGGFQGEGMKTVLPHVASAKLTCRLVRCCSVLFCFCSNCNLFLPFAPLSVSVVSRLTQNIVCAWTNWFRMERYQTNRLNGPFRPSRIIWKTKLQKFRG